ncbi:ChaB family protein [Polymorphospora sp. NPDC050346]|uniref:ChaB family protein n=1 Tax=Polymorphospora sp. NPDC050346 TaxID=3155780 RepID=UPI0033E78961
MPARDELPSTLQRSPDKAQRTWSKTHDSAVETYGEGERSHRVAFAALKHSFEKVGDHWEPKSGKGPSDEQAAGGGPQRRTPTAGGVDANASKEHLMDLAARADVRGRSSMTKPELVEALQKANDRSTRQAREKKKRS